MPTEVLVGFAASDPDAAAVRNLQRVVEGMELTLAGTGVPARTDLSVHTALVRACRNKVLADSAERLLQVGEDTQLRSVRQRAWDSGVLPREWLIHHQLTAAAVMQREPEAAVLACRAHLLSVLADLAASAHLQPAGRERATDLLSRHRASGQGAPDRLTAPASGQPGDRPVSPATSHRRDAR